MKILDLSTKVRDIAYKDCKKCPEYLCKDYHERIISEQLFYLLSSKEFTLFPLCRGLPENKKFYIRLYDNTWMKYDTFYEAIDALLLVKDLQLEDCIRLTKIKSHL